MSEQREQVPHVIATAGLASAAAVSGPESREPLPGDDDEEDGG
jgi:hypothetical protein